jgi:hypothetical protein
LNRPRTAQCRDDRQHAGARKRQPAGHLDEVTAPAGVMETVIMGLIRKATRAQAKAAEAEAGLAEAGLAEAEAKVAQEQAAAIARALHEDEVHRRADLEEVAEEEAEAVPWSRQAAADAGMQAAPDRNEHSSLC